MSARLSERSLRTRRVEVQMRKDRGLAPPEGVDGYSSAEEEFRRKLDTFVEAERSLVSLVFRPGMGVMPIPVEGELPMPVVPRRKVRVRPKSHRQGGAGILAAK